MPPSTFGSPWPQAFSPPCLTVSASGERTNVAWGDFQRFTAYTGQLNPWVPAVLIPPLAWFVTTAETVLGFALVLGFRTRYAALASSVLLGFFALGMTAGTGLKAALNYSVFAASAGAFALAIVDSLADEPSTTRPEERNNARTNIS